MSIIAYKTNAIIITDYKGIAALVEWANDPDAQKGLVGKKVIICEPTGFTRKRPKPYQLTIINLFYTLVAQSRRFNLDFVFILNNPEYLDSRMRILVEEIKEFNNASTS